MKNNDITILIDKIKLDKELMILDINFIAFKEFIKIINENAFIAESINVNIFNEIKEVINNIIKIKIEINFLKNNLKFNKENANN
jgi:uncharacterized protein (DUF486 family)